VLRWQLLRSGVRPVDRCVVQRGSRQPVHKRCFLRVHHGRGLLPAGGRGDVRREHRYAVDEPEVLPDDRLAVRRRPRLLRRRVRLVCPDL